MEILGYILTIGMGVSLGLFGGGGSLLALPILMYCFHLPVIESTAYSLFVVGIVAILGVIEKQRNQLIRWPIVTKFAIPSLIAVYATRRYVLPALPDFFEFASFVVERDLLILLLFTILIVLAAYTMIRPLAKASGEIKEIPALIIVLEGLFFGFITGLVGAGGGFILVPVLVIFLGISMRVAVGTSLAIVAIKSLIGFLGDLGAGTQIDWDFLLFFTIAGLVGVIVGSKISMRINQNKLKSSFGYFILLLGVLIVSKELFNL